MTERRRKRALITRPQEDSADAAIALARRGITPILAPMMRIEYTTADIESEVALAQAILFTSRNGVRAFSRLATCRDILVLAVGDSTAALARDLGFVNVESAQGDSADLGRLTIKRLKPTDGLLFHAAGATVAGDLTQALNKAGFKTVRRALYEAKAIDDLDDETATALRDRTLDYVLFFSPRTGRIFAELAEKAGLAKTCDSLTAICLSDAVASEIAGIEWRNVLVAQQPTTTALLAAIAKLDDSSTPPPARTLPTTSTSAPKPVQSPWESTPKPQTKPETKPGATSNRPGPPEALTGKAAGEPPEKSPANSQAKSLPNFLAAPGGNPAEDDHKNKGAQQTETVPETSAAPDTNERPAPVEQIATPDEDGLKPQEGAMTETKPSRPPSDEPPVSSDEAETESAETETAEMRDSAAALSAVLASPPPTTESAGRSRISTILITLIAVIIVLGAGYATLPSWHDRLPPMVQNQLSGKSVVSESLQQENQILAARLAELTAKLEAKENELGATASRVSEIEKQAGDLNDRLAAREKALSDLRAAKVTGETAVTENAALKTRIAALTDSLAAEKAARTAAEAETQKAAALAEERAGAAGKLSATLDTATGRIAGLEKNLETARKAAVLAGKTDTIAIAARKLRDALHGASPFATELAALKDIAGEAPAVAAALGTVEPLASSGITTRRDLFARLPTVVAAAVTADRQPKNDGWVDRTMAKLTGFITIRRIDGKGSDTDAILARAEMAARNGDLSGAITEMSSLTGAAADASASWISTARNRLAAERARADLDKIALTGVTAGDPS